MGGPEESVSDVPADLFGDRRLLLGDVGSL